MTSLRQVFARMKVFARLTGDPTMVAIVEQVEQVEYKVLFDCVRVWTPRRRKGYYVIRSFVTGKPCCTCGTWRSTEGGSVGIEFAKGKGICKHLLKLAADRVEIPAMDTPASLRPEILARRRKIRAERKEKKNEAIPSIWRLAKRSAGKPYG